VQSHEEWFGRAEEDFSFAQIGFREKYFSHACFLSQQAVEKSLKAFLLLKGRNVPRIHKVVELANLCVEISANLEPLKNDLKLIDEFYIPTRYPDAVPGGLADALPGRDEARAALETASTILQIIRNLI
jgi:HEPN domain-containing protein